MTVRTRGTALLCPCREGKWLLVEGEVAATILLPAGFVGFGAEGFFLAPTGGGDVVAGNTEAGEVILDSIGAALAESEIVFGGTAFVAMTFDGEARVWITFQKVRVALKNFPRIGANGGGVIVEEGITHFLEEEFIEAGFRSFDDGCGNVDGNADTRLGIAAGSGSGKGVGSGVGRSDGGGTLRSDSANFRSDGDIGGVSRGPGELDGFTLVDGVAIGTDRGCGLHRCRGRGRRRRWSGYRLLFAASDQEKECGERDEQSANEQAVRVNHACPPRHREIPCGANRIER